jgi:hypothetical protein
MLRRLAARVVLAAGTVVWLSAASQDPPAIEAFLDRLRTTDDVVWLEQVARSEDFLRDEWRKTVRRAAWDKRYRQDAYIRLGALATAESVAAIARVQSSASAGRLLPDGIESGTIWHAPMAGYAGPPLQPTASAIIGDRSYAVLLLEAFGPFAAYVLWQDPGDGRRWSRPRLAGLPSPLSWSFEPALTQDARGLLATFTPLRSVPSTASPPRAVRIHLADLTSDNDGDGWTDFEERHLGLNPANADTDGDGRRDDVDAAPRYAPAVGADQDEDANILRQAIFAAYALSGSRWALFVRTGSRPLQLAGFPGPVIFGVDLPTREDVRNPPAIRGGAQAAWKIAQRSATEAVVDFIDWAGTTFRTTSRMKLRKLHDTWVVVERTALTIR